MKEKLLRELKSNLEYMSNVERKIASVIIENPKNFTTYSLIELSMVADVSQGSIINFANKFTGGGFSALKLEIAASLSDNFEQPFTSVADSDSLKDILCKTTRDINEALKNTTSLNEESTLKSVCELILKAKKVEIYGIFRSAVVATDFYYQLLQIGIPATFVSDVLTCAVSAATLTEGSLVIAISSSGQTQDIIDAVKLAKGNGVPVVCITAHKSSTLAKLSDEVLVAAPSGNSLTASPLEIRHSQLALTDAICSYLISKIDSDGQKRYLKMNQILTLHNVRD